MNQVALIGRLTRNVELRFTPNGKAVATFGIAVNRPFSKTKEADFFNVVVWGKSAENCANYLGKGRLVGIQGRLQSRSYDGLNGEKRFVVEVLADFIQFLDYENGKEKTVSDPTDGAMPDFESEDVESPF